MKWRQLAGRVEVVEQKALLSRLREQRGNHSWEVESLPHLIAILPDKA